MTEINLTTEDARSSVDQEHLVDLLQRLIRVRSISPPGNEGQVADILATELMEAGIKAEKQLVEPGRPNILARIGKAGGRVLMFNAHMDTVPAGDESQWTVDPFEGVVRNGNVIGRGAVDDKGGLAAMTVAMVALKRLRTPLSGQLLLTAVMGEEVGHLGTAHLLDAGVRADMAIVGEWSSARQIALGYRGRVEVHLDVRGRSAHGSRPEQGVNAIDVMTEQVIPAIKLLDFPYELSELFVIPHPTLAVTGMEGGVRSNMIPDHCKAALDIRLVSGQSAEEVCKQIDAAAKQALKASSGASVSVSFHGITSPFLTDQDSPLVQALAASVEQTTGQPPKYFAKSGTSDANLIARELGVPVVAYGPGNTTGHAADEYVEIEDLVATCVVYMLTAARLLSD